MGTFIYEYNWIKFSLDYNNSIIYNPYPSRTYESRKAKVGTQQTSSQSRRKLQSILRSFNT